MMDKKTFVITTDQNSDYEACMSPILCKYDYIQFKNPASVIAMNGHEKLYDEDALDRARRAGEDAAWNLARKIICSPTNGGYSVATLHDIFGSCLAGDCLRNYTCREAANKINDWEEKQAKTFCVGDVVMLHWGGDEHMAVVTWTKPDSELLGVLLDDGNVSEFIKSNCTKVGKTIDFDGFLVNLRNMKDKQ